MGRPSALLNSWCILARNALSEVIGRAMVKQPVDEELRKWTSEQRQLRAECLSGCSHLAAELLSRLIELAASAWGKSVIEIQRATITPSAARSLADRAIGRLEGLVPLVDPCTRGLDPITIAVACSWFQVSRKTLHRAVRAGALKDYRPPDARANAALLLDPDEIERLYARR
jgi:hypothetical protein